MSQLALDVRGAISGDSPSRTRVGCQRCVSICIDGPVGPHTKSCGCPCVADGCAHAASDDVQGNVTEQQRRLRRAREPWHPPMVFDARVHLANRRANLRRDARWWELEALRGYPSSEQSAVYAQSLRWLVELLDHGVDIDRPLERIVRERKRGAR